MDRRLNIKKSLDKSVKFISERKYVYLPLLLGERACRFLEARGYAIRGTPRR